MRLPAHAAREWLAVWRSYRARSKMPGTYDEHEAARCGMRVARREVKHLKMLRASERKLLGMRSARREERAWGVGEKGGGR